MSRTPMPFAIYALAAVNFAIGTQSFAFAGLLPELAADLGVTVGTAGLLVAGSAITFAVGAPFATAVVASRERKQVILSGLLALVIINALCAITPSFAVLLGLRILSGVATAFIGALATVAAAALVPPERRGRAFALVLGGLTVAFVMGVPLGSALGGVFGWRATFVLAAVVSALAFVLIWIVLPKITPTAGPVARIATVLRDKAILQVLLLTLFGFWATFTVVAFLGPIITDTTGATGAGVGVLQAFIGLGSIAGLAVGGTLADRKMGQTGTLIAFVLMALTLASYWLALSVPAGQVPEAALATLIFSGAAALFALVPINLTRLSYLAGPAAPIALALNGSVTSLGQGLGAAIGGLIHDSVGAAVIGPAGAAIALAGLLLGWREVKQSAPSAQAEVNRS